MSATDQSESKPSQGSHLGLYLLLGAIVLGVLVGAFYGRRMWLASGGPQAALVKLSEIHKQKEARLEEDKKANKTTEVERLQEQLTKIDAEMDRLKALSKEADGLEQGGTNYFPRAAFKLITFAGDLFLRSLKLLVIPLVVTSMVCGVTSLGDIRKAGRLGAWTMVYFLATTLLAVAIGLILCVTIRPGKHADDTFAHTTKTTAATADASILEKMLEVVRGPEKPSNPAEGMIPENIFRAAAEMNVMGLIIFALVFGAALTTLGEKGRPAIKFFEAANEAIMKMVHLVMLLAPVGIFGLLAANIAKRGGGSEFQVELARLAWYAATVLIGLVIQTALLMLIYWLFTRKDPFLFTANMLKAIVTAASTSSSSATLPVTMECVEENCGVSNRVAGFVVPLGATVNMNGTALYEAVAAVFIAQTLGIELSLPELLVVMLTATLAAIGAAGIPEAGLVTMTMVLTAVGLPVEGIGTILAIDWFLDRARTTVNIYGDAIGAGILDLHLREEEAKEEPAVNPGA
jgi:solute carrier family 1 (neuronal/epithelial high affinity glutamate transporter), member 1